MGSPIEPWGIFFSVFEIKQQQKIPTEKNKTRTIVKQLVCFLGVWEVRSDTEGVTEGKVGEGP